MVEPAGEPGRSAEPDHKPTRAGRDLGAAAGVGLLFVLLFAGSLFINRAVFVAFVVVLIGIALTEFTRALRVVGIAMPLFPLLGGALAMPIAAYAGGLSALAVVAGLVVLVVVLARLLGGPAGYVRDVTAGVFATMYIPFLAGFAVLLLRPEDGPLRVLVFAAVAVLSDLGGLAAGVLFGRHKLAPEISPGKTWEGLVGSATACLLSGWAGVTFLLGGPWWVGLVLGAAITVTATGGDLVVSMFKRDVGIKDMGSLLPGHGGIMDRLDSLLPSALISWIILTALV